MLRLLKLAAYSLLGYALYEFFRGATGGDIKGAFQGVRDKIEGGAEDLGRRARHMVEAASEQVEEAASSGGGGNSGGGNRGMKRGGGRREETGEPSGTSVGHKVGRGVVS